MTKKMAHHFLQAPENYSAENAVRWGQLKSLGASETAIKAVNETRLGANFDNEDFWFSYFRFIAENPMLDHRQIGPLFDFLNHQKYEETQIPTGGNQWQMAPPAQPGLTLRGRNVATLMGHMEDWHRGLGKLTTHSNETYATASFFGYTSKARKDSPVRWTIRQLLNAQDLQVESKMLRHCVSSYHRSCLSGRCTIWSLSKTEDGKNYKRRQTIEVDSNNTIIQCRGLANRDPKEDEWNAIKTWVKEADLSIASYLV